MGTGADAIAGVNPEAERGALHALPLVTLYLSERCNSRCVGCDYWRHGHADMSLADVERWLPGLQALGTRVVLISGGEPLLHPEWAAIAQRLRAQGLRLWLLTSGLSLAKHADAVGRLFESVTVSLDGCGPATYAAVRGLDAFEAVCTGIRAAVARGLPVGLRATVQRANFRELPQFAALAHRLGAASLSFLPADIGNPQAFGRSSDAADLAESMALRAEELPELERLLDRMEREQAADFDSGFIRERPAKLRQHILGHYRALCGLSPFPPVRCNAPEFSAVIEAGGALRPCFFIAGTGARAGDDLPRGLNDALLRRQRADIRAGRRAECGRCVCAMWREPGAAW